MELFLDQLTDLGEVSQRCLAIDEIREELHFKDIARACEGRDRGRHSKMGEGRDSE